MRIATDMPDSAAYARLQRLVRAESGRLPHQGEQSYRSPLWGLPGDGQFGESVQGGVPTEGDILEGDREP